MLSSGYLVSGSNDNTLRFWDFIGLIQMAKNTSSNNQAIPCIKEVKPGIIAFGGENISPGNNVIYFWNTTKVTASVSLNQVTYSATGPGEICTDMKLYGPNNLAVASNQQDVDVWTLDSYTHSSLTIVLSTTIAAPSNPPAPPVPPQPAVNVLCIEPLSRQFSF